MKLSVSLLLCTARPAFGAYVEHPEWHTLGRIIEDLNEQTVSDFELIVVSGDVCGFPVTPRFQLSILRPRPSPWVREKRFAVCAYRNTGIAAAQGELIVNLDDCCRLPRWFVDCYEHAWQGSRVALAMLWAQDRPPGVVGEELAQTEYGFERRPSPRIYGFGSYPREAALKLGGYDEAYDGGRGLEDMDWSTRLHLLGVRQALYRLEGFELPAQGSLSPLAIDLEHPVVKCCNQAWWTQRMRRQVLVANKASLWNEETLAQLVGPCPMFRAEDGRCGFHNYSCPCEYPWLAAERDEHTWKLLTQEPPVVDWSSCR